MPPESEVLGPYNFTIMAALVPDLKGEEVVVKKEVDGKDVSVVKEINAASITTSATAITPTIYIGEITLARALIEIKTSRPKAKGIVMQEPSETTTPTPIVSSQQPSKVQDKGKRIMVEPKMPSKKKAQISLDEGLAFKLQAKEDKQEKIVRKKAQQTEEVNLAWDDIQAKVDAAMKRVNMFVDIDTKVVDSTKKDKAKTVQESSSKRARVKLEQESSKKQKIEDENEFAELQICLEIVPDDADEVTVDATPLSNNIQPLLIKRSTKKGGKAFSRFSEQMKELNMRQRRLIDYSWTMSVRFATIQSGVKRMILAAQSEVFKQENVIAKMLCVLDQQMEKKEERLEDAIRYKYGLSSSSYRRTNWAVHLSLAKFSYNNSYHSSIRCAPFEALYGRKCRSPVLWAKIRESGLIGPELVQETIDKRGPKFTWEREDHMKPKYPQLFVDCAVEPTS
nr:putative reverse transcriptase domain-containing protein [Tanacetum cinerariifolium]